MYIYHNNFKNKNMVKIQLQYLTSHTIEVKGLNLNLNVGPHNFFSGCDPYKIFNQSNLRTPNSYIT